MQSSATPVPAMRAMSIARSGTIWNMKITPQPAICAHALILARSVVRGEMCRRS